MPIQIIRNDITKLKVDAVVNAANESLLGGGGVDGAIHRAAGKELLDECRTLGGCRTGEAKITKGYKLPAKFVIHTVGPIWKGGADGEKELLISCYKRALELASKNQCQSVAFPLISSGVYGYPKDQALKVALDVISEFLLETEMTVYIVVFDKQAYKIGAKLFADVKEYIDDYYVEEAESHDVRRMQSGMNFMTMAEPHNRYKSEEKDGSLEGLFDTIDESFTEMLLRKIDEKGIKDSECYKKANIDRKLFSKIRSDREYHPRKQTAVAFAVALELSLNETTELLRKAGFALSRSSKFDLIVEYFIKKGEYNINEINEVLFEFDQKLLGL